MTEEKITTQLGDIFLVEDPSGYIRPGQIDDRLRNNYDIVYGFMGLTRWCKYEQYSTRNNWFGNIKDHGSDYRTDKETAELLAFEEESLRKKINETIASKKRTAVVTTEEGLDCLEEMFSDLLLRISVL